MGSPFEDLDPDEPAEPDDAVEERGVPPLPGEPVPQPEVPGDRLRRPTRTTPDDAPADRRPRRDEVTRPAETQSWTRAEEGEAGGVTAFLRGLVRHCPRCGGGRLFHSWFRIRERCPRCGFRLEREEGGFLGAMTINYAVTAVIWLAVFVVWLVVDLPDVHVLQLTLVSIGVAVLVPLLVWPFSKTLWSVVDYLVTQSEVAHIPDDVRPPDY